MLGQLFILFLVSFLVWLWWHSTQLQKIAKNLAKKACEQADVQFLDDTVALKKIYLTKHNKEFKLGRVYCFEFALNTNIRKNGFISFIGNNVNEVFLKYNPDDNNSR
jgi:hypothetical protein